MTAAVCDPRFWLMIFPVEEDHAQDHSLVGWYAVCDEEAGGIVAYFNTEEAAEAYVKFRNTSSES